jgi:signal transduction histidine kinase
VGSVGHELRNPLGVMSNAIYFLKTVLTEADPTVREYLDIIEHEIGGAERVVAELLDAVRTKPPQMQRSHTEHLLRQALRHCTVPEGVAVEMDIPENLTPIQVDPQQIQRVFRNLIANGIDAMAGDGHLTLRAVEDNPTGMVRVTVQDTGSGIKPEQMEKLFLLLYTTKARGIGLGLMICKSLVEANGGRIGVESEVGRGTVFTVALPTTQDT